MGFIRRDILHIEDREFSFYKMVWGQDINVWRLLALGWMPLKNQKIINLASIHKPSNYNVLDFLKEYWIAAHFYFFTSSSYPIPVKILWRNGQLPASFISYFYRQMTFSKILIPAVVEDIASMKAQNEKKKIKSGPSSYWRLCLHCRNYFLLLGSTLDLRQLTGWQVIIG